MPDHTSLFRQWKLLKLLAARRHGITVREASAELDVSQKTVRRDLITFQGLGFPIASRVEKHHRNRWYINANWAEPQCNLTFEEAIALFVSRRYLEPLAGTIFWQASRTALGKIRASLRSEVVEYVDRMLDRLHQTEVGAGDYSTKAELIDRLMIGIEENRAIFITYQSQQSTEPVTYDMHPYGLVHHRGSLYLIGFAPQHDAIRHWKVDRIEEAHLEEVRFHRPADFDLEEHLSGSFGIFQGQGTIEVKILFAPPVDRYVAESKWHPSQQLTRHDDGTLLVSLHLSALEEVKSWILSFGRHAEVLEPKKLRDEIKAELTATVSIYTSSKRRTKRAKRKERAR